MASLPCCRLRKRALTCVRIVSHLQSTGGSSALVLYGSTANMLQAYWQGPLPLGREGGVGVDV